MKYLLLFSLFLVTAKGCGDKKMDGMMTADIGDKITLKVGEMVHLKDSDTQGFRFSSVEADSRCPTGVNCMQAGSATILIEEMNKSPKQVNIPAKDMRGGKTFSISGAKVKVISLAPYPTSDGGKIAPGDYELTVELLAGNPKM